MPTLTKKLKQHTPVLHFQPDAVAPIRATELKPKLDKFIIANYHGKVPDEWFVKTDNKVKALNYKMRIICNSTSQIQCQKDKNGKPILPMFFGDGKTPLIARDADNHNTVTIELFCLNKGLYDYINEKIDWNLFFLTNNFGTRQDKGYGSFYPEDSHFNGSELPGHIVKTDNGVDYRVDSFFTVDDASGKQWDAVMKRIDRVARCMRSGINLDHEGIYFKSLMFAYAKSKGLFWDKRVIKENFYPKDLKNQRAEHPDSEELALPDGEKPHNIFRDFLGLSTFENWREPYHKKITKKDSGRSISRFKSPLLFKPIWSNGQWFVFLLHREIPTLFFKGSFIVKDNDGNYIRDMRPYQNFSMSKYLNYIFDQDYQYEKHFQKPINDKANRILKDLNTIRKNYEKINTL